MLVQNPQPFVKLPQRKKLPQRTVPFILMRNAPDTSGYPLRCCLARNPQRFNQEVGACTWQYRRHDLVQSSAADLRLVPCGAGLPMPCVCLHTSFCPAHTAPPLCVHLPHRAPSPLGSRCARSHPPPWPCPSSQCGSHCPRCTACSAPGVYHPSHGSP